MAKTIFDIGKKVNNDGMTPEGQLSADEFNIVVDTVKGHDIGKFGYLHYDTTNNRYIVFASEDSKDAYLQDPTLTDLVLGTFDAPFNYEASITLLTPSYNSVFLGSTGNYLDFTFDIKNKEGNSTGENVNVTYTFIRNATKRVVTETRRYGESVHFNIDEYLLEGTNTIIIGVTGQTTLAATTAALTYQVVNLSYSDDMDIAKVYNLSEGKQTLEVFFSVTGYGTKVVEWFLDGVQLDFVKSEDEVVDLSSQRTKYIELSNLTSGVHTLQSRVYTLVNGEKFYTDTLYREILVNNGDTTENYVVVASNLPMSHGIVTEENPFVFYGVEQYIPYDIRFATMKTGNVSVSLDDLVVGTLVSNAGIETNYTITSSKSGSLKLKFSVDGVVREFQLTVNKTSLNIEEITSSLSFDFRAVGKNNNSVDKDVWSYQGYTGTFDGFQWNASSGWVNNALLISEGASFSVDIAPLANDATRTGKTLEFEFSTRNVNNDDAVVCDLTTDGKGLLITASEARITSAAGEVVSTRFKAGEMNRITFVINRKTGVTYKGLVFIYVNGILSGVVNYGSADNFLTEKQLAFTGTEDAQVELRAMRFYDTELTADNVLNNYTLYRHTLNEMMEVYYRNAIYAEGTQTFSPDAMLHRLPVMVITGDIPTLEAATSTSTQILVDIDFTNEQDPTKSFRMTNAALRIQGTSSLAYPRKNYRFYTRKEESTLVYNNEGELIKNKLYSFKDGAQPVDCWCLKADYAESSGTHNTGIARLWNDAMYGAIIQHKNVLGEEVNGYALRTQAQIAALNAGYEYDVRTTIDGFPIVVFYKQNASDTDLIFLGKYNFNNDKSTPSVFGFENIPNFDNSRMQCWETRDNGHPLGLFTDISKFDTDWSEAFESRYPDTKTPILTDLKAFSVWLNKVSQSDFATQKWAHFDVYKVAAYYCYLMRFGAVDQPVKNAFLTSEDGEHFYFINYDNDTINGLINTGRLALDPTVNRETIGSDGEYVYAGHDSVLWNKLTADAEFMEIVPIVDNALYSAGLRYDKVIEMFNKEQADKWVERVYNQDAEYKYLLPYVNQATNNLFMLQGSRSSHRSWWLSKRFSLYDSIFLSGAYRDRNISFKCLNDTPIGQKFTITAATRMGYGYGVNNGTRDVGIELESGDLHTFTTTDTLNLGDVVKVFAAANLEALDLSEMTDRLAVLDCSAAADPALGTRMKRLIVGGKGKVNTELASISGINVLSRLQMLNVKGCQNITSLDLTKQKDFRKLYAAGSGVASVDFAAGAPVDYVEFPSAMMSLNFNQLPYLTLENIVLEGGLSNISYINISGCPNLTNNFSFIKDWLDTKTTMDSSCTISMDGIRWMDVDASDIARIARIAKAGGTVSLKGEISLSQATDEDLNIIREVFGENVFIKGGELWITSAPMVVVISDKNTIVEGESLQFTAVVFSEGEGSLTYSLSGETGEGVSIDPSTGLLTTTEDGGASVSFRVVATFRPNNGGATMSGYKYITVQKAVYPTQDSITIVGEQYPSEREVYTWETSVEGVNVPMYGVWSLQGDITTMYDVETQNTSSCTIRMKEGVSGVFGGTVVLTLYKSSDDSVILSTSRSIIYKDASVMMTSADNPAVMSCLFNAGLASHETYMTYAEAEAVTDGSFNPTGSQSGSIFYNNKDITSFDELQYFTSLTTLDAYCFYGCTKLTSVKFPQSMENFGTYCCYRGSGYTNLTIDNVNVKTVGSYAFYSYSTSSSMITINNMNWYCTETCSSSRTYLFYYTNILKLNVYELSAGYSSTSSSYRYYQHFGYAYLHNVKISESITSIPQYAFYYSNIYGLEIPDSVTNINSYAFYVINSTGFKVNKMSKNVATLGYYSFQYPIFADDVSFQSLTFSSSACISYAEYQGKLDFSKNDVGGSTLYFNQVFYNIRSCKELYLPARVLTYSYYSTSVKVERVYVTDLKNYCSSTFSNSGSPSAYASILFAKNQTTGDYEDIREFTPSDYSIESISSYAFYGCKAIESYDAIGIKDHNSYVFRNSGLKTLKLDNQNGLGTIAGYAFANCTSLETITDSSIEKWGSLDLNSFRDIHNDVSIESQTFGLYVQKTGYSVLGSTSGYVFPYNFSNVDYTLPDGGLFEDGTNTKTIVFGYTGTVEDITSQVMPYSVTIVINSNKEDSTYELDYMTTGGIRFNKKVNVGTHIIEAYSSLTITPIESYIGFLSPTAITYNSISLKRTITMNYKEEVLVKIKHIDGTLYTGDEWVSQGFEGSQADGVLYLAAETGGFLISKNNLPNAAFGGNGKEITGIKKESSYETEWEYDMDGFLNTRKIIEQLEGYEDGGIEGAPIAESCVNFKFPSGVEGYLPAAGELYKMLSFITEVNSLLTIIGGDTIRKYSSSTEYFVSSTLSANNTSALQVYTYNGQRSDSSVSRNNVIGTIRPFAPYCVININKNINIPVSFTIEYTDIYNRKMEKEAHVGSNYYNIKLNTEVTVTPSAYGNLTAEPQTFIFNTPVVDLNFTYSKDLGAYIHHIDGSIYTGDEWSSKGFGNDMANGVILINDDIHSFVIAKDDVEGYGYSEQYPSYYVAYEKAIIDFDGERHTEILVEKKQSAGMNCIRYQFPIPTAQGYMPSLGELNVIYNNKSNIDSLLVQIGGSIFGDKLYNSSSVAKKSGYSYYQFCRISFYDGTIDTTGSTNPTRPIYKI